MNNMMTPLLSLHEEKEGQAKGLKTLIHTAHIFFKKSLTMCFFYGSLKLSFTYS